MLEWLKTVLGDAYTPEIDTAVSQEIGKGFVARTDFNTKTAKVTELETEVKQLREGIKTRDTQLSELKKSAGDNAELQKQIDTLTQQNKDQKAAYDKELATVKLTAAVDAELTAAGSKNNIAVRAMLADFLKDAKVVDGKAVSTLITVAGINDGREYVVLDGLKVGDEIVSTGAGLLREGTQVK